jgi:hypothetical protein
LSEFLFVNLSQKIGVGRMINDNKYKNNISMQAVFIGIILAVVGYFLPNGLGQSIVVNIASNFITTGVLSFFIIDRILLAQKNENKKQLLAQENKIKERNQQSIDVILYDKESKDRFELPIELLRGEFTRGEILGRIGMLPMKEASKRFSIDYLGGQNFLSEINKILANYESKELVIPCEREEIEQFKMFEKYKI